MNDATRHTSMNPSIRRIQAKTAQTTQRQDLTKSSFDDVFTRAKQSDISITKHARSRLATRGVSLSPGDVQKVSQAMDDAAKKGIKEAVIVMNDQLLVASVTNRTIITAANKQALQAKIISNIDGAIFL